jgi:hypothetical protein
VQETSWLVKLHKRIKAMKSTKSISLHILGEHQSLRLAVLLLKCQTVQSPTVLEELAAQPPNSGAFSLINNK